MAKTKIRDNQERNTMTNLTNKEIEQLKKAKGNEERWNELCDQIKHKRNGQYPPDWYSIAITGILESPIITIEILTKRDSG